MEALLSSFRAYEVWIYLILSLGGLIYIRKFVLAWQEIREASFGLERESAQSRLNQAASVLVLLLTVAVIVFVLVSFVAPIMPGANLLPTGTLDLLATPTTTLPAQTPPGDSVASPLEAQIAEEPLDNDCVPGEIEISIPGNGEQISGIVSIIGSADIPNFGFYKFEIKRPDEAVWLTIQAGNVAVKEDKLGDWDTSRLIPGEYQLSLVVVDNQAQALPPCVIQLRVTREIEATPGP